MDRIKFRDEIEAALMRGFRAMAEANGATFQPWSDYGSIMEYKGDPPMFSTGQILSMLRERANNIAQAYADRVAEEPEDLVGFAPNEEAAKEHHKRVLQEAERARQATIKNIYGGGK